MTYTSSQIHKAIREAALHLWDETIVDQDNSWQILRMFEEIGWSWIREYKNSEKFAWCGVFAGVCANRIGNHLEPGVCVPVRTMFEIVQGIFPSTQRLSSWQRWDAVGPRPKVWSTQLDGRLSDFLIPGAVVTVSSRKYGDRRDVVGGHIVIVDAYHGGEEFETIEGNAFGAIPGGTKVEGVIRRTRKIADVKRVYLLTDEHLDYLRSDVA